MDILDEKKNHHEELCKLLHETYLVKNEKYGDSFGKSVTKYGPIVALTRMSDKFNRIENLILQPNMDCGDEPIYDTLLDLANYSLMTYIELNHLDVGKE